MEFVEAIGQFVLSATDPSHVTIHHLLLGQRWPASLDGGGLRALRALRDSCGRALGGVGGEGGRAARHLMRILGDPTCRCAACRRALTASVSTAAAALAQPPQPLTANATRRAIQQYQGTPRSGSP